MPKPNNFNRQANQRLEKFTCPYVNVSRAPLSTDIKDPRTAKYYERPHFWRVGKNPTDSSTEGDLYYLADITSNSADWKLISTSTSPGGTVSSITGDSGGAVGPTGGTITFNGKTVANATNSKALHFKGTPGSSLQDGEIQISTTVTPTPGDASQAGICSFNENQFQQDATSGMVSLKGSTVNPPIASFTLDDTNTATADANGDIDLTGSVVDNGTNSKPLFSARNPSTDDIDLQLQVAGSSSSAPGNKDAVGLVQLDSNFFNVNSDGWVTPAGGASAGFVWDEETGTSRTLVANEGIFANNAGTVTLTLPVSCNINDAFAAYQEGAGKVRIAQNASQQIRFGNTASTSGAGGYIESLNQGDSVVIVCVDANRFRVINSVGSWTVA